MIMEFTNGQMSAVEFYANAQLDLHSELATGKINSRQYSEAVKAIFDTAKKIEDQQKKIAFNNGRMVAIKANNFNTSTPN
jgi:hypothetical protein